eukprot:scaffold26294_cov112-Isochrysis_galbana.AAC.3
MAPAYSVRRPSSAMRAERTAMPAAPCTCSTVLKVSIGVSRMRKQAAAHEAKNVLAASEIHGMSSRSASVPALAAVSPKRERGAASSAAQTPR